MKAPISQLLTSEASLLAILPSALNGWVEEALTEHGIPDLLDMVGIGQGRRADSDERDEHRRRERERAEQRRLGLDSDSITLSEEHGIAILKIEGTISPYYWNSVDPRGVAATMRALADNPAIRTIILDIDSPGGHATYVRELAEVIREVSLEKRTVAYSGPGQMMCSAAYWIGAACDEVYGATASMPGSVGVFSALYEFKGMLGKLGVSLNVFRDGPLKGMGLFGKELTDEESAHIQAGVDKVSVEFKGFVRAQRPGIAEETMHGQAVDGDEAVEARLYDAHFDDLAELVAAEMSN
jgi:signal peptide peptidase SppA